MGSGGWTALQWLALVENEMLLFAGAFFLLGALDEFAVDLCWAWLRITGKASTPRVDRNRLASCRLSGAAAVFIPAWQEASVIGQTVSHALRAWPQPDLRIYVGCYANDANTCEAARAGACGDDRLRIVRLDVPGPTTKADCLNHLYRQMKADETSEGKRFRLVLLHDAEDMVDAAALALIDGAMDGADFVQIPVLPMPQARSKWVGSHYLDEFCDAHGRTMVVRAALGAALPAAGVGCAFSRGMLARFERHADGGGPFSTDTLTEDYELGLRVSAEGGRSRFLRVRGNDGRLVATRAYFPETLAGAVRQKSRWIHGIAFQGWNRMGWTAGPAEWWMRLRDRRGPLAAVVLATGYSLLALSTALFAWQIFGHEPALRLSPLVRAMIVITLISFAWRSFVRFAFAAREFGWREGVRAILRIPVTNVISIMAGRRALSSYVRSLRGEIPPWEKTAHDLHPADAGLCAPARP
ncbi:glycosyl transferase family protein [Aurantiacibacter spongiae]|uniref:Glycosyl transferase family protein n=1 Tax=Aurantiacibacter spongiae TaxID=2488860 RepID=A0A3N5CTG6_9SPHN|nr:glycosyl transferase family protein [Aurantiacibacter spongiae]RPF71977.1 glycosyl transferase family protein [Aurantiacibacter spongiae]